jgi:signal transduction histidine kinase
MTVSQRLYLAVVPGIVGVFTVAGLAYWGQYDRQAPDVLVIAAVVVSVTLLVVAWRNTRYVATRVTRLAAPSSLARVDELDAIEEEVDRLRRAAADAVANEAKTEERANASIREYGGLVADTAMSAARQLDEIRMPLHILLENHFGELNENQEEMLAAARDAADDAQSYLERLREIAALDCGALRFRSERIRLADLISALLPGLAAEASHTQIRVSTDIPPFLPPVAGDRARVGEALSLLATDAVHRTSPSGEVRITGAEVAPPTSADHGEHTGVQTPTSLRRPAVAVQLILSHGTGPARETDVALASRLVVALGGRVDYADDRTVVTLPVYALPATPVGEADPNRSHTSR